ncbi:HNH endonuclease signature motif containing protein [Leifsonia sp. WHRI 6310E]|uniref:HNH endonuclease n=1 Tax=Leifsonia sp. WHRI 6310E TaxID=3162562 RepID=UPI0032EC50E9
MSQSAVEAEARDVVDHRDERVCVKCRRVDPMFGVNWDHRKNRSQGGEWRASNGQLLCGSGTTGCHGWKTSHPMEAREQGYSVPGYADPAEYPARRWAYVGYVLAQVWVLYDDAGQWVVISEEEAQMRIRGEVPTR